LQEDDPRGVGDGVPTRRHTMVCCARLKGRGTQQQSYAAHHRDPTGFFHYEKLDISIRSICYKTGLPRRDDRPLLQLFFKNDRPLFSTAVGLLLSAAVSRREVIEMNDMAQPALHAAIQAWILVCSSFS